VAQDESGEGQQPSGVIRQDEPGAARTRIFLFSAMLEFVFGARCRSATQGPREPAITAANALNFCEKRQAETGRLAYG
jgi:hypothetical protein